MATFLEEISQISIYFKDENSADRVNEVALLQPLSKEAAFNQESKPLSQRKWTFFEQLPLHQRVIVKVQSFIFQRFQAIVPKERKTAEAKFKTVLAILLSQESLREFFLGNEKRREHFFKAIKKAAKKYEVVPLPMIKSHESPLKISHLMTTISGSKISLIDDEISFNLQMSALSPEERNEILFTILDCIERPPITSVLEVTQGKMIQHIETTTTYSKYRVNKIDDVTHRVDYTFSQDQATPSVLTIENIKPGAKGAMNQRMAVDTTLTDKPIVIGMYSGELLTVHNVLEQILFILQIQEDNIFLLEKSDTAPKDAYFLFTSLFSWGEFDKMIDEHASIATLDKKILQIENGKGDTRSIRLHLLYKNISFSAWNKFPLPSETEAHIEDLNEETLIYLTLLTLKTLKLDPPETLLETVERLENAKSKEFLERQKIILEEIDRFRVFKEELIKKLSNNSLLEKCLRALLSKKTTDGHRLKGMDEWIYTHLLAKGLGILTNINCQGSIDLSAGANACDKAQNAFQKICGNPYIPDSSTETEQSLFKVLYSMYLVWEEPELTSGLSTGFIGERFFKNFFQKNPETTHYLIRWLKKHPEIYLRP